MDEPTLALRVAAQDGRGDCFAPDLRDALPQDLAGAYVLALQVRSLRQHQGWRPAGFKVGFTNRQMWPRYQVFEPIWSTVWQQGLQHADKQGRAAVALDGLCQPRLEPEAVFGFRQAPRGTEPEELFDALDWVAPGVEIVQSHWAGWRFTAPETVVDGGLHARLVVGRPLPVRDVAVDAESLHHCLQAMQVRLQRDGVEVECGRAAEVLDGPMRALQHFLRTLSRCPGAPWPQAGDVVTTGTWTDAWPVQAGQSWQAVFDPPFAPLTLDFA